MDIKCHGRLCSKTTHGYWALEMWPVRTEMCSRCKIYIELWRHSPQNVNISTRFTLFFEMVIFWICWVKLNILLIFKKILVQSIENLGPDIYYNILRYNRCHYKNKGGNDYWSIIANTETHFLFGGRNQFYMDQPNHWHLDLWFLLQERGEGWSWRFQERKESHITAFSKFHSDTKWEV